MREQKFFRCKHCGNMVGVLNDSGVPMICCGEPMQLLVPNTVEASAEKHIPAVTVDGDMVTVQIGSVAHPMVEEHHIEFIYLMTETGAYNKRLKAGDEPTAKFNLSGDKLLAVYEYCNLHGLWKIEL